MGQDGVDISHVIQQIQNLQAAAERMLKLAYRSQDGKGNVNAGLLKEGQSYLQQAQRLIDENIVPILQSLNPAAVATALGSAGASRELTAAVLQTINAAKGAITAEALSTQAICQIIKVSVYVLWAAVGIALLAFLYSKYLDSKIKKEEKRALQELARDLQPRPAHRPFEPRFIPQRL